jgi:hypothetical protein
MKQRVLLNTILQTHNDKIQYIKRAPNNFFLILFHLHSIFKLHHTARRTFGADT